MTDQVEKIEEAVLDKERGLVALTLAMDDGSKLLLELRPSLLTELVGLVGMATEMLSGQIPVREEDVIHVVGVGVSPNADNSALRIRFADKDGFLHSFEADESRAGSLRIHLRRAIGAMREAQADTALEGGRDIDATARPAEE